MPVRSSRTALCTEETPGPKVRGSEIKAPVLSADALDDRIAIVGTAGSETTQRRASSSASWRRAGAGRGRGSARRVVGLRASADGAAPGYPVIVFGGRHADVPITAETAPRSAA